MVCDCKQRSTLFLSSVAKTSTALVFFSLPYILDYNTIINSCTMICFHTKRWPINTEFNTPVDGWVKVYSDISAELFQALLPDKC